MNFEIPAALYVIRADGPAPDEVIVIRVRACALTCPGEDVGLLKVDGG